MRKAAWITLTAWIVLSTFAAFTQASTVPKVLIIGIDGCRPDALQAANTPNLDALITQGTVSYTAVNEKVHGGSGPNWTSMLTGVHKIKHGVLGNATESPIGFKYYNSTRWPHFFSYLKDANPLTYTASYSDWGTLDDGLLVAKYANARSSGSESQSQIAAKAADLLRNGNPDALFVQFDAVDGAGHTYGFLPTMPGYVAAIETADGDAGTILNALYDRPGYQNGTEDWLILCTTDHGGTKNWENGKGYHDQPGGGAEVWTTFLIAAGPSVKLGCNIGSPNICDVAVTALAHMGINTATVEFDGHVLSVPEPSTIVSLSVLVGTGLLARSLRRGRRRGGD